MRMLFLVLLAACDGQAADRREIEPTRVASVESLAPDVSEDSILAVHGRDTVRVMRLDGVRALVWSSVDEGSPIERFRSGDLFGGVPRAELRDVDRDGLVDLFVAWQYEEQASGLLLRARVGSRAEILYQSAADICGPPELAGPDEDGWPLVIEYEPGAASLADCREGASLGTCVDNFFVEWPRVLSLNRNGTQPAPTTSRSVREIYAGVVERYEESLLRMRDALARDSQSVCDATVIAKIEELQSRAKQLAQSR